jgi:hypothetical protein
LLAHPRFRTLKGFPGAKTVIIPRLKLVSAALAAFFVPLTAQLTNSQSKLQISPSDLVKAVIYNELHPSTESDVHWKYRLDKQLGGKQETREVVETKSGSLDKLLLSSAGKPLTEEQRRDEDERILKFIRDPEEQKKAEQARRKDAAQCDAFLNMIPSAFLFQYAGESGNLVKVMFKPNPQFRAPSREAKVLQQMAGEMWIEPTQKRLASIDGQLTNEVKFAGGILGHLEKGGRFMVKRAEVAPGDWEVAEIAVNMQGKALFFKSISVQQKEVHSDFERLPAELTLADAANLLLRQTVVAVKAATLSF